MKFFKKLVEFFRKTKTIAATTELKIAEFVRTHKKQIKLMMSIFEVIFPAQSGAKKMACVVNDVCYAIGLEAISQDVADLVEKQCQKVYDEFKASLN